MSASKAGPESTETDVQVPSLVDALGERLLRASGELMDMELTATHAGQLERAMRLNAKRAGVELALSYLNEELRIREAR